MPGDAPKKDVLSEPEVGNGVNDKHLAAPTPDVLEPYPGSDRQMQQILDAIGPGSMRAIRTSRSDEGAADKK